MAIHWNAGNARQQLPEGISAVRWARDHSVAEVPGLTAFDEDDLCEALDDLRARQDKIEKTLRRNYLACCAPPRARSAPIAMASVADSLGEPLAVRVCAGTRGVVKGTGKRALDQAVFRYISALTDPQIRLLLTRKTIQLELFVEQVREAGADGVRYNLRKNPEEARRIRHRLEDKLDKLREKIAQRNELVQESSRRNPEAGLAALRQWTVRYKIAGLLPLRLDGRKLVETANPQAELRALELAGSYAIVTDAAKDKLTTQAVHGFDVERDITRLMNDGGIVRNRLKIGPAIGNAKLFLNVRKEFGSFDRYIWRFVDGEPRINGWQATGMVHAHTRDCLRFSVSG